MFGVNQSTAKFATAPWKRANADQYNLKSNDKASISKQEQEIKPQ